MENSYRYFENHQCKYYPCHKGQQDLNCLFCYCPMFGFEHCLGNPVYLDENGKRTKDCSHCAYPHRAENYDAIINFLENNR